MPPDGDVTRMRLVGGNLGLDFVNTRSGPPTGDPDDDVLIEYRDLVAWADYAGAISADEGQRLLARAKSDRSAAAATLAHARRVRDDLDDVLRAIANGGKVYERALERLRDDESDALRHAQFEPGTAFTWQWHGDHSPARPLWPVVHAAVDLLLSDSLDRIKQCRGCSFLFLDESKNRSRRWCSMDDCGTDEKMRRYVDARRAARQR